MTTTKTTCPYCGVGCGVLATKQADGSVAIKGDPDHPANFGRLCSKGSALGETLSLDDRMLYPQVEGERVSWDNALDLVAEKFADSVKEHGPDSVAFYVSGQILTEDYYVANKLMKGYIGSANIDTNSRLCMASSVAGHRKAFGTDTVPGSYEDLEEADLLVLVGSNLAWCHPVIYQRIAAAKEARPSMKVVLVDPRRTMTANLADIHLPINPDGDVALFAGLLVHLSKVGVLNVDYIEQYTNGFEDALTQAASHSNEQLMADTGLSLETLEEFYTLFENTEKVVTVYSQGVNQSECGTDKVNAIINCHFATGRIGKAGMGPFSITGQPNAMGGREVGGLANMLAAHMNIEDENHRAIVQNFWNSPTMPTQQGLKAVDMFQAVADGRIKALWIMATNPVDSMPDADFVQEAIKNCPFVVVSDVAETTDTVRHANVKLPAFAWGEKDGTVTNSERRISRQRAFLEAPGDAKADWWHMAEVAKRMGFNEGFDYRGCASIFREHAALSTYHNDDSRDFDIGALSTIDAKDYDDLAPFQWPYRAGEEVGDRRFFSEGDFYTPDRKGRFIAVVSEPQNRVTEDHPFILNTGRIRDQWHTMTRTAKTARLSSHLAEPFCEIHPDDAARLHINDADLVALSNERGIIFVRALITDRQKVGNLFVPLHWTDQYAANARVDTLFASVVDPFSGQPALKNLAVNIERFKPTQYGFLVSKEKPDFGDAPYWALAKTEGGWRAEFALMKSVDDLSVFGNIAIGDTLHDTPQLYSDPQSGNKRAVWFKDGKLLAAIFLAPQPVAVARSYLVDCLKQYFDAPLSRQEVIAARPPANRIDKGAIICSCFGVGANEIISAAARGCHTVKAIGDCLSAGTNCGSCKSEIASLLNEYVVEATDDPPPNELIAS